MDIVSDRYSKFTSEFWAQVFKNLETNLSMSFTNHLQPDGQTERVNQIIEDMHWAYLAKTPSKWEQYLPILEFVYNSFKHISTRYSPFNMLLYGFQPCAIIDVTIHHDTWDNTHISIFNVDVWFSAMCRSRCHNSSWYMRQYTYSIEYVKTTQDRARFYVDRHPRAFIIAQKLLFCVPTESTSFSICKCGKLAPWYCGPLEILKRCGSSSYHLTLPHLVITQSQWRIL